MSTFKKAVKTQIKARIGLVGPAGSGKTLTALIIASALGERIAVIDSEHSSALRYADRFNFDHMDLTSFNPKNYISAMREAENSEYDVIIMDGISQAWQGKDGVLEQVDRITASSKSGNAFTTGWRTMTPEHNNFIESMLSCKTHLIVTMRSKTEYVIEEINGKKQPRKIGMAPVQREGMDYEFDVVCDMDWENNLIVSKTRCSELKGKLFHEPNGDFANIIKAWVNDGEPQPEQASKDDIAKLTEQVKEKKHLLQDADVITLRKIVQGGCTKSVFEDWMTRLKEAA